ncbi:MAG: hypothetical protein ACK56F_05260, partial [bacterium]
HISRPAPKTIRPLRHFTRKRWITAFVKICMVNRWPQTGSNRLNNTYIAKLLGQFRGIRTGKPSPLT